MPKKTIKKSIPKAKEVEIASPAPAVDPAPVIERPVSPEREAFLKMIENYRKSPKFAEKEAKLLEQLNKL